MSKPSKRKEMINNLDTLVQLLNDSYEAAKANGGSIKVPADVFQKLAIKAASIRADLSAFGN